jgi:pectate lyase
MEKCRIMIIVASVLPCIVFTIAGSPNFALIGYATTNGGTTGGAGGTTKTIGTLQELTDWAAGREKNTTSEIVTISGKIIGMGDITIKNGANITIQGSGSIGELSGVGLNIRDYTNVIVKNLKIHEVLYPDDGLTLDNVQRAWIDHCELYSKIGSGITVDTYDGLLDIKKGSSSITISWCYLHDHMKCSLVGHSDDLGQQEEDGKIRVTYHHNYFVNTDGRNPSLRYGAVHLFNNYFENIADYGLAARDGGHAKVENCHYENVKLPMSTDKFMDVKSSAGDKIGGYICQSGNIFTGACGENVISQTGCDFWNSSTSPYSYTLDDVNTVKATVQRYAGFLNNSTVAIGYVASAAHTGVQERKVIGVRLKNSRSLLPIGNMFDLSGKALARSSLANRSGAQRIVLVKQTGEEQCPGRHVYTVFKINAGGPTQ